MFFRNQNKYGPEQISVAILDDHFIVIMVSGLLTPFLKDFLASSKHVAFVIEEAFILQVKNCLEEIFSECFSAKLCEPLISFDKENDKIIAVASWRLKDFLDTMCT